METAKNLKELSKALGIADIAPDIYKDLLQPSIKVFGNNILTIAKSISIALAPIEASVWGYDRIKMWLSTKLTAKLVDKKVEEIQTPPLIIAGPLLLNMLFAYDENELKNMYANLLASSMCTNTVKNVHPSYVHLIQQLSPDEAKILFNIKDIKSLNCICNEFINPNCKSIYCQFEELCKNAKVEYHNNSEIYLDNLIRLRILSIESEDETKFVPAGGNEYGTYEAHLDKKNNKSIYLTEFGYNFIRASI